MSKVCCSHSYVDYAVYNLVPEPSRFTALSILGSSYVVHTFQVRPFSNSVEAIVVALSLLLLRRLLMSEAIKSSMPVSASVYSSPTHSCLQMPLSLARYRITISLSHLADTCVLERGGSPFPVGPCSYMRDLHTHHFRGLLPSPFPRGFQVEPAPVEILVQTLGTTNQSSAFSRRFRQPCIRLHGYNLLRIAVPLQRARTDSVKFSTLQYAPVQPC